MWWVCTALWITVKHPQQLILVDNHRNHQVHRLLASLLLSNTFQPPFQSPKSPNTHHHTRPKTPKQTGSAPFFPPLALPPFNTHPLRLSPASGSDSSQPWVSDNGASLNNEACCKRFGFDASIPCPLRGQPPARAAALTLDPDRSSQSPKREPSNNASCKKDQKKTDGIIRGNTRVKRQEKHAIDDNTVRNTL